MARSSFYAWLAARPSAAKRQKDEEALAVRIRQIHVGSRGAYGVPRVHAALRRQGLVINRKKVERVMAEAGIRGITRRKRRGLTRPDKKSAPAKDLLGRDFTAAWPGTKLVGDITFLPTLQGLWYLARRSGLERRQRIRRLRPRRRGDRRTPAVGTFVGRRHRRTTPRSEDLEED